MDYGNLTPWALFAMIVINLVALAKLMGPKILEAYREKKEQEYAAERQDDIALWQNMVGLQTRMQGQNDRLINYVLNDFRLEVDEAKKMFREESAEIKRLIGDLDQRLDQELADIDKRWLTSSRELAQVHGQQRIGNETLARAVDGLRGLEDRVAGSLQRFEDYLRHFEQRVTYLIACIPELAEAQAEDQAE